MNKWIHIIGVSGTATSALAVMFKNMGWKVTGSDKAFFPPASSYAKGNGIEIKIGFNEGHLYDDKGQNPDLIMYQGMKGENNPEILKSRELGLKMYTYPELLQVNVLCPNSIVITGTYGKTTITSALVDMFENAKLKISYMYAGIPVGKKYNAKAKDKSTEYSILEGDEYIISLKDKRSKFELYSPKYLILNAIEWEHLDEFKTESDYVKRFENIAAKIPEDGFIVANANKKNVVKAVENSKCQVIYYSIDESLAIIKPDWKLIKTSKPLPCFVRDQKKDKPLEIIPYEKKIIGDFNEENFLAAAVLSYELGIKKERIQEAIKEYKGIKRRLEVKFENKNVIIIDDLGSSPPKAKGAIKAIRDDFPKSKLIAVFEPNAGNRVDNALPLFEDAFKGVDEIILPRFSILPKMMGLERFSEKVLYEKLKGKIIISIEQSDEGVIDHLCQFINKNNNEHIIILFLSSHNLRGMIENLINKIEK